MKHIKIAIAQINATVGDLAGNVARLRRAALQAREKGAHVLLAPELVLCGYPPEDLLLRPDFYRACAAALDDLAQSVTGITLVVGYPAEDQGEHFNAAAVITEGRIAHRYFKMELPNYEVFDEERYFVAGDEPCVADIHGVRCGIAICADIWEPYAARASRQAGAEILLVLNASPLHLNKTAERLDVVGQRARENDIAVIYANLVGGQDELVFDGASFALNRRGELMHLSSSFVETVDVIDYRDGEIIPGVIAPEMSEAEQAYRALVLGVRDYVGKNGFPGAVIGLSGGVDSALTLTIAVDALGAGRVRAIMMPSPYTAQMSLDDSRELIKNLGVRYDEIAIEPAMQTFEQLLAPQFAGLPADTTEENLQARIRGMILMAISNKTGALVLTTGNKSEMAVGYATLYGDMAGGFAVIKDVYKTFVYRLCRYRNAQGAVIPENILTRAPSAELKPNQTDQDSLPPYEVLDAIIEAYMEHDKSADEIIAAGFVEADVKRVIKMLTRAEYKRRQSPPGVRVTRRAFGKDWRYPITSRYEQ